MNGKYTPAEIRIIKSFLTLYQEKPFVKISVTEVCQVAHVSRVTFYTYFEDISQLKSTIEYNVFFDLAKMFNYWKYTDFQLVSKREAIPIFQSVIEYVYAEKEVYKALFGRYADHKFVTDYNTFIQKSFEELLEVRHTSEKNGKFIISSCQGAVSQLCLDWIAEDFATSPVEVSKSCSKTVLSILKGWGIVG